MTGAHFTALADMLRASRPWKKEGPEWDQWLRDVQAVASVCWRYNARFKKERFYEACEAP